MKILFCSPTPMNNELGAARSFFGVADCLQQRGWDCHKVGLEEVAQAVGTPHASFEKYPVLLRQYLQRYAAEYDIIDFDMHFLPCPRTDFPARTLMVARSVLLNEHLLHITLPSLRLTRQKIKAWLTGDKWRARRRLQRSAEAALIAAKNADLINVANEDDREVLSQKGIEPQKICVIPYGLSKEEFAALDPLNLQRQPMPRVCFLGTFDERKGGGDMLKMFELISDRVPGCRYRLLGTEGLVRTRERVLSFFAPRLRNVIEVIPRFLRSELPGLLEGCTVGVFPSYVEGFGFGVLEMMAAGMPVFAYRCPGPPMMLGDDALVPKGDYAGMANRVIALLIDDAARQQAAELARARSHHFSWENAADLTEKSYLQAVNRLRNGGHESQNYPRGVS